MSRSIVRLCPITENNTAAYVMVTSRFLWTLPYTVDQFLELIQVASCGMVRRTIAGLIAHEQAREDAPPTTTRMAKRPKRTATLTGSRPLP